MIAHLTVIIILLASQLDWSLKAESTYMLDFSKVEELERLQREVAFKEEISHKLDELISSGGSVAVRNVTVDRGTLKDDRHTDAEQLYKDAERLQQELDQGFKANDDFVAEAPDKIEKKDNSKKEEAPKYSGPSVLSWELDGRKASRLPIPAYKCFGAGEVTVIIGVDNAGTVVSATVKDDASSADKCLRSYAVRAARLSKFSSSTTAPTKQMGSITYSFIAQ